MKVTGKNLMEVSRIVTLVLLLCNTAMAADYPLYVDQGHPAASDTNAGTDD
jgi:hypothetical protein